MHGALPYVAYTGMCHPCCVFLVIFFLGGGLGLVLMAHVGYNHWYLMRFFAQLYVTEYTILCSIKKIWNT